MFEDLCEIEGMEVANEMAAWPSQTLDSEQNATFEKERKKATSHHVPSPRSTTCRKTTVNGPVDDVSRSNVEGATETPSGKVSTYQWPYECACAYAELA